MPYTNLHTQMKTQMKNYTAWFQNDEASKTYLVACDGISESHAQARAWIKFFDYEEFREDEDSWELETVELKG
jgi:hypothetical protein